MSILRGHHISRTLARILFKLSGFDVPLTCRTKKRTATTVIANAEEKRIDESSTQRCSRLFEVARMPVGTLNDRYWFLKNLRRHRERLGRMKAETDSSAPKLPVDPRNDKRKVPSATKKWVER